MAVYTTIDNPELYFQTKLYTGNSAHYITGDSQAITLDGSENMQPDLVWIKSRTQGGTGYTGNNVVFDSVRGTTKRLAPTTSEAELTQSGVTAFGSDGFTVGPYDMMNNNGDAFAAWSWKAGTSFSNDASATGIGSIDSSGSASDTAGFSIVSWTGTGSNGTIKHGLSSTPKMIFCKRRDADDAWWSYNATIGAGGEIILNEANAAGSNGGVLWNSTAPTSSVFSVGTNGGVNGSGGTYIAYAFADVKGFSSMGSYLGNGSSSGIYLYLGFKPSLFICKRYNDAGYDWLTYDNKRQVSFNVIDDFLKPNLADAETTGNANQSLDFLSNGVKFRGNGASSNGSGASYIYMAFAENPFVTSTGVPTTAR